MPARGLPRSTHPLLVAALTAWLPAAGLGAEPEFVVMLADGSRLEGPLTGWHQTAAEAAVADRLLFDPANPARSIVVSGRPPPALSPASITIELVGGDRVPGRLLGIQRAADRNGFRSGPRLAVEVDRSLPGFAGEQPSPLRIDASFVTRIVRGDPPPLLEPVSGGLLRRRDGSSVAVKSLRWSDDGILALTDDGLVRAGADEIEELRLPRGDDWESHLETLTSILPSGEGLLIRAATVGGLAVTGAVASCGAAGDAQNPATWRHRFQPAWSDGPIWLDHAAIVARGVFAAHEVPLSRIRPAAVERRPTFGGSWLPRRDQNVFGRTLSSGGRSAATGLGLHGACTVTFPLPPLAASFRGHVGLDTSVGEGGCIRAAVTTAPATAPIWQSDLLAGSAEALDTGLLSLPSGPQPATLAVVIDDAHDGRPAAADAFDVRDVADWLDPLVILDPAAVREEVRRRAVGGLQAGPGLAVAIYDVPGSGRLPDFAALTPAARGVKDLPDLSGIERATDFGLVFTGFLELPAAGSWKIHVASDDGTRLFVAGNQVIDNDGEHAMQERSATLELPAGRHPVRLEYAQGKGDKGLAVFFEGPGTPRQVVPASAWSHADGSP